MLPMLHFNYRPEGVEFLEETLEVHAALVQNTPEVSETLWSLYPMVCTAWDGWGWDYLRECVPVWFAEQPPRSQTICAY
eukprot:SAG31_NODE_16119_length_722_cov_0.958266_1_plen_79_part_00